MKSTKQLVQALDTWRDTYNPLRGLTMPRAVSLLESINAGTLAEVMWAFDHIEQTDPDLLALVERRITAIEEMDYDIRLASEEKKGKLWDKKLAEDQQAFLASAYERIDNLNESIAHMAMATFRKYAFCQMRLDDEGLPTHLECLDQWNFARRGRRGPWYWNPEAQSVEWRSLGEPLDLRRDRLIVREVSRYVDRYGLIKYVRGNLSEKDWDGFVEIFGFNQTIVILPPAVGQDKLPEYLAAAQAVSQGGEGALPGGSDVKFPNESRGQQPFRPRLEWLQQQLILAGTGGLLTMLSAPGAGTLAGGARADTFRTLGRAEAKRISEVYQGGIDKALLNEQFPGKPHLAYFQIAANEEQDVGEVVDHADKIARAFPGYSMDRDEFSEKTGYRLVEAPKPLPDGSGFAGRVQGRDGGESLPGEGRDALVEALSERTEKRLMEAARESLARAMADDLSPLRERIEAALAIEDDQAMLDALLRLDADLPDLMRQIAQDPKAGQALEEALTAALFNGIAAGAARHASEVQL